jgi:NRPS condensation-like uncharacterized protein
MQHLSRYVASSMAGVPLRTLDELYLNLDRADEPWSIQVEARVGGRIDVHRLAGAVRHAARRHPIARARLAPATELRYRWEIAPELDDVALTETASAELPAARERLFGHTPALDRHGPFELLIAHDQSGDAIALNLHHAAGDGVSALALMRSIARAYGDEPDPEPPVDPLVAGDTLARSETLGPSDLETIVRGPGVPARIARHGGDPKAAGYGFELTRFDAGETERIAARRRAGATLDDVLLGALALAVHRWNERHDAELTSVHILAPINLRPPEWRLDVLGNFAPYVSFPIQPRDLQQAVAAATDGTRRIRDGAVAGLIVELFAPPPAGPKAIEQRVHNLMTLTGNLLVDTAVLSSLGAIDPAPRFGDAGAVTEVWFSLPARMPLGLSIGAAGVGGRLFVTLRYRHALFDAEAAREFTALYRAILLGGEPALDRPPTREFDR